MHPIVPVDINYDLVELQEVDGTKYLGLDQVKFVEDSL